MIDPVHSAGWLPAGDSVPSTLCFRGVGVHVALRQLEPSPPRQEELMRVGLLWFDNSPDRGLAAKIDDAARRYQEKFGAPPDTCYLNQAMLAGGILTQPVLALAGRGLRIVAVANVLPHHFWVGVEDAG